MELDALVARLKALSGPDRDADWDIHQALFGIDQTDFHGTPRYTASLDDAIALVERKLPGAFYHLAKGRLTASEPLYAAQLLFGSEQVLGEGEGPSLPIALCIALLFALSHSSSKGESRE